MGFLYPEKRRYLFTELHTLFRRVQAEKPTFENFQFDTMIILECKKFRNTLRTTNVSF